MRSSFRSVRARLTIWYTGAMAVTLAAFAVASLWLLFPSPDPRDVRLLGDIHSTLIRDFTRAAGPASSARSATDVRAAAMATVHDAPGAPTRDVIVAIYDSTRHLVVDDAPTRPGTRVPSWRAQLAALGDSLRAGTNGETDSFRLRARGGGLLVRTTTIATADGPYTAATLLPLHSTREIIEQVQGWLAVTVPLVLILAGLGGWFLAGRALAPMRAVTEQTSRIGPGSLDERLPIPRETEVAALATVVNGLLQRVEESFSQQRRFMTDASHELRTPVAILRVESDVALGRPHRTEQEYRESLQVIRDAGARLGRIVDDLFLLSRVDAGEPMVLATDGWLDDIVRDAARAVRGLAEQREIALGVTTNGRAPVRGDSMLLGRLMLNLLQNAVSYSHAGSTVMISLATTDAHYLVTVADSGPGIALDDQSRIFDRFYRGDKARSRDSSSAGGAGLGLSIARWIAEVHGGSVTLASSSPNGSVFEVRLPAPVH